MASEGSVVASPVASVEDVPEVLAAVAEAVGSEASAAAEAGAAAPVEAGNRIATLIA